MPEKTETEEDERGQVEFMCRSKKCFHVFKRHRKTFVPRWKESKDTEGEWSTKYELFRRWK